MSDTPEGGRADRSEAALRRLLPLVVGAILALTLVPTSGPASGGVPDGCPVCSLRGLADVVANVLLFLPLGAALLARTGRLPRSVLLGAALSAAIELAQFRVPGRDPSLHDLLLNTLGTALGALLLRARPPVRAHLWLLRPLGAAALALAAIGLGGLLLAPDLPPGPYHASPAAPGGLADPGRVRDHLLHGGVVRVDADGGTLRPGPVPLLHLFDARGREVLLLGLDGARPVYRARTRAAALGLGRPRIRAPRSLSAPSDGRRFQLRVWRTELGLCMGVDRARACSLGFTPGDTWRVLAPETTTGSPAGRAVGLLWIAALFLPAGLASRRVAALALLAPLAVVGLLALARVTVLLPPPPPQLAAALAGLVLGWGPGRRLARRRAVT